MPVQSDQLADDFPPSTATDGDCRCDPTCADCRRTLALEQLLQFAAEQQRTQIERAKQELDGASEHEQALERTAAAITQQLLVNRIVAFCQCEEVEAEMIDALSELFDPKDRSETPERDESSESEHAPTSGADTRPY